MMSSVARVVCGGFLVLLTVPVFADAASHAHVHGVATIDLAVEPSRVILLLDSPLENLVGFERAPRTDAERKRADAMVIRLQAAGTLFTIDPAARCSVGRVELMSPVLKLGTLEPGADDDGHADIEGSFEFICEDATRATYMDTSLLDAFPRLQRIELQVATATGQFKRELKRPARRIVLTK